jgi:hypothetical protein
MEQRQIETLAVDGVKYVIGESLFNAAKQKSVQYKYWINKQIKSCGLIRGVDLINFDKGVLFTFEAADKIVQQIKLETKPARVVLGFDEDGLPILPPQKTRHKALINPYRI